ncbi:MAG: hypothetical protein ACI3YL_02550 [Prevotella sp.]|nr:hypothetical protein [Prevotella sp.]MCI5855366.1 hypothetical protein [Prevotella sp.]MDY6092468.1 hypothetical protein [Prevotella sp.]
MTTTRSWTISRNILKFTLDGRRVNTNRSTSPILLHNGNRWRLVAPSH